MSIQPVISSNSRFIISFNGQIYNINELKKKFNLDKNIKLDTKIILELFERLGLDSIQELKGMFAILVFDKMTNSIYAFRDNSGQNPFIIFLIISKFFSVVKLTLFFKQLEPK